MAGFACRLRDGFAFGDQDLGLDDINTSDFLCHSVFHLNTGVYLDKVELARFHIHQEFDGTRAFVIHMRTNAAAQLAQLLTLRIA